MLLHFLFIQHIIGTKIHTNTAKIIKNFCILIESIQNTNPAGNNINYAGENYLGGIVGRIQYASLDNCNFEGSETNEDYIRMSGHRSPDSAFCGGIVGLIRTATNGVPSSILNCNVKNTEVVGNATNFDKTYGNPDIYVGGIVGAAYLHGTNSTVEITNCYLQNSTVYALGNEILATYAAGIIAGATWESSLSIEDCYVTDSTIRANISTNINDDNVIESSASVYESSHICFCALRSCRKCDKAVIV